MDNRRPNSCPVDPWKSGSDFPIDRPKSVLERQEKNECRNNESSKTDITSGPSENTDLNRAKVNPWIESKEKGKTAPNASGGSKLFHHYPQRRVSPSVASEMSGTSRPQTEPGRTRPQILSKDVKNLPRKSVDDAASAPRETGAEISEPGEGWVVLEKSTSDTVMPCDSDDESNVVVPRPDSVSQQKNDALENQAPERSPTSVSDKSTLQALSNVREKATSGNGEELSGLPARKLMSVTATRPGQSSMANILTFATSISRWKQRRNTGDRAKIGFAKLDPEQRAILQAESDHMRTEIPEAMMRTIKEEAYCIMLKTAQIYRSQIGSRHKLTKEAYDSLIDLQDELQKV